MISRVINSRYEILERVGSGTIFQVYKARDKSANRIVALKMLLPPYASDPAFCEELRRAAQELASLADGAIARVYEVGEEDGAPFLVTDFVRGINLKERIRRIAPFTLSIAVDFAIAIGDALHKAHSQGIAHGALRPQNVIISPEGQLKVTDFGLESVVATSPAATQAELERSAPYEAPERAAGSPPSAASDVYSLGVILFEMLTGTLPYTGDTPEAIVRKAREIPVPSPRDANPGVPRSVEGIIMKAMQKRPEERYQSAADILSDLRSVRDALRFGKSLSWSPIEATAPVEATAAAAAAPPGPATNGVTAVKASEPEPAGAARMSATSADDRVSPYLKAALLSVTVILLAAIIALGAIWMATFAKPPIPNFPNPVGRKFDDVQRDAEQAGLRLIRQDEYNEKVDAGVVYHSDWSPTKVRPGRSILVWVSKGSRMVWVPDVSKQSAEDAESKLRSAGLQLGTVNRANDSRIGYNYIISQNPRPGKRVERDTPVNIVVSDGPKIDEQPAPSPDQNPTPNPPTGTNPDATNPTLAPNGGAGDDTANDSQNGDDSEARSFNLAVTIKHDGKGNRRVRVEYDDARGTHPTIDEYHDEGDVASQQVQVYGPRITVRVYYSGDNTPVSERTYRLPKKRE